ncbi:MAG: amidophosphoribosyltransferase [Streptococcaceae bacterium]|nr:amidophosphoribosyltransferase [Streptococcaceae bacterium]
MLKEIKGLNEECGIFGVWGHKDAAQLTYYGLHSLQHRGQEGAGIVVKEGKELRGHRGLGLIADVFGQNQLAKLTGEAAIGHVRYSTAGGNELSNVQPFLFHFQNHSMALAHNGNLINSKTLRGELENKGTIFASSSDSEVLAHLIAQNSEETLMERLKVSLNQVKGGFAYLLLTDEEMIAALDPNGFRPLSIGMIDGAYVVASETCAFDVIGAKFIRDVEPGEMVRINNEGIHSEQFTNEVNPAICAMEYIYFARPDSNIKGINVHTARKKMGKTLAQEAFVEADVVTGVPDSSISAAIGYAETSGIPYELGLIKNRYVARTFIQPSQELRELGVKMKLSAVRGVVEGKRVVMIDDSIVRGTTSKRIVSLLREAGAKEVHVRIGCPPLKYPCFYGIDIQTKEELIAANHTKEEICEMIGADSLEFLSVDGLVDSIGRPYPDAKYGGVTMAYFNGDYPTQLYDFAKEVKGDFVNV